MLNAPRPAFAGTGTEYRQGVLAMKKMGCTVCHVADWTIRAADGVFDGDRRFFDLDVAWNAKGGRLEGRLVPLFDEVRGSAVRRYEEFVVKGLFSDLRHHDMGDGFAEMDFGGTVNTLWRTPPLWGVASGFPWGHDGQSLTLEDVILRHDGEGAASKAAWLKAGPGQREKVLNLLAKLVLYDIESLPADVDGDGKIAGDFMVAGVSTGYERFNAEWLFATPVEIQGPITVDGHTVRSFCGMNIDAAYGQDLEYRKDSDADGWPDEWDHAPNQTGYKDGVN
jgi:hypothetical protein